MGAPHKILACVDHSPYAEHVADHAAWAARRLQAPLEFLHVLERPTQTGTDHSGTIGIDAQQQLLEELSSEDEARSRAARERGRLLLDRLRQRALVAGVGSVDVRQRHGQLGETLAELQAETSLFVLGRRGESASVTQRALGRHVEHTLRALRRPVLTVTEGFREPRRVMIAYDGSAPTRRGVRLLAASPTLKGLPIHVVMSGPIRRDNQRQLDWARNQLEQAGHTVQPSLIPGDPERVIAEAVVAQSIDLLVMGAYSHSPLRSLIFGSKTTDLLRALRVPTLLLR